MRWQDLRPSSNIEFGRGGGGRGGGLMLGGGGLGLVAVAVIAMLLGVDPRVVLGGGQQVASGPAATDPNQVVDTPQEQFVANIVGSTEDVWGEIFRASGSAYEPPRLQIFDGQTTTQCGQGVAAMGPFYCPLDRKVYIDLTFFNELTQRFGAGGDFANAYVVGHEVGHHVQTLMGTSDDVRRQQARLDERRGNQLSVRLELQADCYAGVWANRANRDNVARNGRALLEPGDVEEGLAAANAIGDDTLQRRGGGRVVPDAFTHGTSVQRVRWFRQGLDSGDPTTCDTFSARSV